MAWCWSVKQVHGTCVLQLFWGASSTECNFNRHNISIDCMAHGLSGHETVPAQTVKYADVSKVWNEFVWAPSINPIILHMRSGSRRLLFLECSMLLYGFCGSQWVVAASRRSALVIFYHTVCIVALEIHNYPKLSCCVMWLPAAKSHFSCCGN